MSEAFLASTGAEIPSNPSHLEPENRKPYNYTMNDSWFIEAELEMKATFLRGCRQPLDSLNPFKS